MSVKVSRLTKVYGAQRAVDAISFEARPREVLGFLGPNGAGKTTTMKILTGYLPATEGEAEVCGYKVSESSMEVRRCIGYLPEHNPLYKDMYVKEFLHFTGRLHGVPNLTRRVAEMVEMTGLGLEQNKPISALSKGYRQRVGLAQAMIHNPEVLILDEPTSGLDPNQLAEIRQLIKNLGREKTVIFSTHIMQEVEALCDRVVIINRGKIVADDPISQVQQRLGGQVAVEVEFQQAVEKQQLEKIPGVQKAKSFGKNRWQLLSSERDDIRPEIFKFASEKGLTLVEMKKEEVSIEDVFQQLTKN